MPAGTESLRRYCNVFNRTILLTKHRTGDRARRTKRCLRPEGGKNIWGPGRKTTPCPWCRRHVPVPRGYRPRHGEEIEFLRCECGAVGVASLQPDMDWPRLAAEVLGAAREEWPHPTWGRERIEQYKQADWDRIQR